MQYIVLDLEWNTAYSKKKKGFVNEIIEFGAAKLNEEFEVISTFSSLVQPQISPKLNSHVKKLTSISNEELKGEDPYEEVFQQFADWSCEDEERIYLSWGDMDIRTLISNNQFFFQDPKIPFLPEYVDFQAYFMHLKGLPKAKQIGLSDAAKMIDEDPEQFVHHRALEDSLLAAVILRDIYEEESFEEAIFDCDEEFYKRILFKPYYLDDIRDKLVDQDMLGCKCMNCGRPAEQITDWKYSSNAFHAVFHCPDCNEKYRANVSFKRLYNQVSVKKTVITLKRNRRRPRP